jgi:hypothetical protein
VSIAVTAARQEWEEGNRRFEEALREPAGRERLLAQVEVVTDELRRRIGQTFTLAELADVYTEAERWVRDTVAERAPAPGWLRNLASVEDAAFHLYARGAVDYEP